MEMLQSSHRAATTNCVFLCLIANALGLCLAKTNKQTNKKNNREGQFNNSGRGKGSGVLLTGKLLLSAVSSPPHTDIACVTSHVKMPSGHPGTTLDQGDGWPMAHIHGAEEECMSVTESLRYPKFTLLPDRAPPPFLFLSGTCSFSSPSFSLLPLRFN